MVVCATIDDLVAVLDGYFGTVRPSAVETVRVLQASRAYWDPSTGVFTPPGEWDVLAISADDSIEVDMLEVRRLHAQRCVREVLWPGFEKHIGGVYSASTFAHKVINFPCSCMYLDGRWSIYDAVAAWWDRMGSAEDLRILADGCLGLTSSDKARLLSLYGPVRNE